MKRSYIIASLIILFGIIISWPKGQKFTGAKEQIALLIQAPPTLSIAHYQQTSQKTLRNDRDTTNATDSKSLALQ